MEKIVRMDNGTEVSVKETGSYRPPGSGLARSIYLVRISPGEVDKPRAELTLFGEEAGELKRILASFGL